MTSLVQVVVYMTLEERKKLRKRRGELGIRFDSVFINMLITRDSKKKLKF